MGINKNISPVVSLFYRKNSLSNSCLQKPPELTRFYAIAILM